MSNLNLKGLWVPIEILTDKNLSNKEKHIYSHVIFLSQEKQYCFCTNKTISELLNISVTQVSKLVNSLKTKGYINIEMIYKENSKEVDIRKLMEIGTVPFSMKRTSFMSNIAMESNCNIRLFMLLYKLQ